MVYFDHCMHVILLPTDCSVHDMGLKKLSKEFFLLKSRKKCPRTVDSCNSQDVFMNNVNSSDSDDEVSHYNSDLLMPIFSSNCTVLPPLGTIRILHNVDSSNSPLNICHGQPIEVG